MDKINAAARELFEALRNYGVGDSDIEYLDEVIERLTEDKE